MSDFLDKVKAGAKVQTRGGLKARFVGLSYHGAPVFEIFIGPESVSLVSRHANGRQSLLDTEMYSDDIILAPVKRQIWGAVVRRRQTGENSDFLLTGHSIEGADDGVKWDSYDDEVWEMVAGTVLVWEGEE